MQIRGGEANPSPPIGPALSQYGVDITKFCRTFNERTRDQYRDIVRTVITVYKDRSFSFITKSPPTSALIKQMAGVAKGSEEPGSETAGSITSRDLEEIARIKFDDLSAHDIKAAMKIIAGTARSMGITVEEQ